MIVKKEYDKDSSLQELMEEILVRCQPIYSKSTLTVVLENGRAVLKGWPTNNHAIAWVEPDEARSVKYRVLDVASKFDLVERIVESELDRFTAATGATFVLELAV